MAKKPQKQRPKQSAKYTIAQAFSYFYGPKNRDEHEDLNLERGIRAVSFLLTWSSEIGNEPINGNAANGLARILDLCAARMGRADDYYRSQLARAQVGTPSEKPRG